MADAFWVFPSICCRRCAPSRPCSGLGSAGAGGAGTSSEGGGRQVAARTQTQAPACLRHKQSREQRCDMALGLTM